MDLIPLVIVLTESAVHYVFDIVRRGGRKLPDRRRFFVQDRADGVIAESRRTAIFRQAFRKKKTIPMDEDVCSSVNLSRVLLRRHIVCRAEDHSRICRDERTRPGAR
jgi:hypothetical protein